MFCARCARETATDPCSHCDGAATLDGRYRLVARLGRGSSGTTWRASGPDGQPVAIKAISLLGVEDKGRELVEREVRVLRALSHPGIPAYVEHIVVDDALWLVQELVEGESLARELEDHRYTPREVLSIIAELAGILAYLHELSPPVIHRDVKPDNVMRRSDGSLALIDFGAVRDVAKGSLGGSTVAGTFGYMPPEQFAGDAEPRSDLYGLGALAVALLTRREPQTMSDHANRLRWTSYASVPEAIHDLVNRMVEPDLERRAPSAGWVQQRAELLQVGRLLEPNPSPTSSERVDEVLEPKPRDMRWWGMALAVLLTVCAVPAALFVGLLPRLRAQQPRAEIFRLPSEPTAQPRDEQPVIPRPGAQAGDDASSSLRRVVATIGEDPAIQGCVAQHQQRFPDQTIQLEVHLAPPDAVTAVEVGPHTLADSAVVSCLEAATMRVALRGVELERPGTVTLAFD